MPKAPGLVTLGETMGLVAAAETGPLASGRALRMSIAGSESNVAVGVSRLGHPAAWIGRVGADAIGDLVLRELGAEHVTCLAHRDTAPTGLMLKHRRTADLTQVTYYRSRSAGSRLSPADIPAQVVAAAGVLHVTGITLALGRDPAAAVHTAVDIAREAGVTVSLDVNYRSALWGPDQAAATLREILGKADVVFAGADEARLLVSGDTPAELAGHLVAAGPSQAVIKLGSDGCHGLIDGGPHTLPAMPVSVADPVGAGDAFVAGYLAELLAGGDAGQRLATATAAAAFVVATAGDWEGLPRRDELSLLTSADNVRR